jgi:ribosome-binding protein aMBF1 (putative translation factor)
VTPRQTFGSLITREREASGLIRTRLAADAGISREALRRIEAGESGANEKTVAGLIRALPVLLDAPEVLSLAGTLGIGWHRLTFGGGRWWVKPATGDSMPEARAVARALVAR